MHSLSPHYNPLPMQDIYILLRFLVIVIFQSKMQIEFSKLTEPFILCLVNTQLINSLGNRFEC